MIVENQNTVKIITSIIHRCEKMQPKFLEGTSQHTLLKNRIKALYVAKICIEETNQDIYSLEDLQKALPPIISIKHKNEKARSKYVEGTTLYKRFTPMIEAMLVAEKAIKSEIKKGQSLVPNN